MRDTQKIEGYLMEKTLAGLTAESSAKTEAEEKAKLEAKTPTASKDDKTETDQKSPLTADSCSLKTKVVDEMLTRQMSLGISQENFPALNKTVDDQIDKVDIASGVNKPMWLACQMKSYLICDEITNFPNFFFELQN